MTPAIGHAIFAVSNSLAASIIVKATIVILIALVAATLARHSRASVRHAIIAAGFVVLLALPIAAIIAPPLHIALPIAQGSSTISTNSVQSFDETTPAPGAATNAPSAAKSEATSFTLFDLVFAAWAIGAAIFLAPVIIGLWQIRSLRRTALPWSHGNSVATTLANELKISRRIEVLLHESTPGPMTCGIFHPAIVFPVEAENWDDADLNRAVAHELEHVRRADWLTHCLARAVCAAYWFHPFVWIAWRQLTLEAERACDDAVLAHSEATAYAEQLVALARQLTATHKSPLLAMASRSDLAKRVRAVLNSRQPRGRVGFFTIVLAGVATTIFVLAISPLKLTAAQPGAQTNGAARPSFEV
ncbi:MAG TPA: M56 family metallopeptidase, partial [Candidatus Acidoferrales bacterium]|nr:M56 family metallopeptidase [Candidatus Acidoferrales bacterium]